MKSVEILSLSEIIIKEDSTSLFYLLQGLINSGSKIKYLDISKNIGINV